MNTNETKVDVLAVMDAATVFLQRPFSARNDELWRAEESLRQARAAVAELIEAALVIEDSRDSSLMAEWNRLTAALSRIGGAK